MRYKGIIQSIGFFLLGSYALLNFYKDLSLQELITGLSKCKLEWVLMATGMHLLNHFFRAVRWRGLIGEQDSDTRVLHYVLAEMTGFFSNLFVPRLGEWTRCSTLKRVSGIAVKVAFPTVIAERSIDMVVFLSTFCTVFITSFILKEETAKRLFLDFFQRIASSSLFSSKNTLLLLALIIFIGVGLFYVYKRFKKRLQDYISTVLQLLYATKHTLLNLKLSTWVFTLLIWISYFLVEYISCFALAETSQLSFFAIFCIFIVINLGTAIPVPGNIGAYHVLMYSALSMFSVPHDPAMIYVTVTHGIQVFNALVIGGICAMSSRFITTKDAKEKAGVEA